MSQPIIQASFNAGEWTPALNARVDMQRYHSAAALLRNFFVDYRGGATTRPGSKYIIQTISGTNTVRLIPFQASLTVSYILVFENQKLYFLNNGSPVLETAKVITGITQANPGVVTSNGHGFANGDRVFVSGVVGMTQVNNNYYIVAGAAANTFQLHDLNGNNVDTTAFTAYSSGGTVARIYTIASPYLSTELAQIKFAQDVNLMILNHPNYATYKLVLTAATNWSLTTATIGSTVSTPVGQAVATTLAAGTFNYAYVITAVDATGQESGPSSFATLGSVTDIRTVAGSNTVTWTAVANAASYNVYRAQIRAGAAVPAGSQFGFVGNCTATTFIDSNIVPDFSLCPPVVSNPFFGSGVQSIAVTNAGAYSNGQIIPTISFTGGGGGSGAAALATAQVINATISNAGGNYIAGQTANFPNGVVIRITSTTGSPLFAVNGFTLVSAGNLVSGNATPASPTPVTSTSGGGSMALSLNLTWGIVSVGITSPGTGYGPAPTVVFSGGAAAATATLGSPTSGNPTVPAFHQQRLMQMGPVSAPNQLNASQPGAFFNFNVTNPTQPDNAFQGTLNSGQLNTIQSAVSQPQGLIILSDRLAWLVNGGSAGSPFNAIALTANAQIFNGAAGLPPIVAVDDVLYVQAKGSIVRDMIFNFQKQVYTGADISVQSSHLFYGYQILEWAYAEEPFKLIWAVRSDGILLTLTFLREQELVAWTHSDTAGSYKSIASVTESSAVGNVDAIYTVVQRVVNGNTVQYIERMAELYFPIGATDAWQVDAGVQYNGASALTFSGAQHLAAASVTGLATDNLGNVTIIPAFVMPTSGTFTLAAPTPVGSTGYIRVTVGLAFTPQLQTLAVDLGQPTVQGKRKKVTAVTARVRQSLGLSCGRTFPTVQPMKDLALGNVGTMSNTLVTDLVTSDARIIVDPQYDVFGQYCFQQSNPYPATILGIIPEIEIGDTSK